MKPALITHFIALCATKVMAVTNSTHSDCHDLVLNIPVTATNYDLGNLHVDSNTDAVSFAVDIDRWTSPNATQRVIGQINITDTFSVYAQLCYPPPDKDKHVVQILSHGALFDHRYWDSELDPAQYSYVYAAVNAGYTVLNYDRIGAGLSQKADAYTAVQGNLEREILQVLTEKVRDGSLLSLSIAGYHQPPTLHLPPTNKVVHVGHSLGSQITAAFLQKYGSQSSGAILTGYT